MAGLGSKEEQLIIEIWQLVEPVVEAEGMELVEVEYRRETQGWVLRLFIDREDGISVNDCARMSQVAGDLLDVADIIQNPYHLEVSSPGLDRPLRKLEHFQRYIGNIIEMRTALAIDGRRRFKGLLVETRPDSITMDVDGRTFQIPFDLLERANLCYFESLDREKRFK